MAALLPEHVLAQGCAMCRSSLAGPEDPVTRAFNWSILLLITVPYVLFAAVGGWLFYSYWRARGVRPVAQILRFATQPKESVP